MGGESKHMTVGDTVCFFSPFILSRALGKKEKTMLYDVIVIGAGVTGSAVARELSRYETNVCVLENAKMSAKALQSPIQPSFMRDLTQPKVHLWPSSMFAATR